MEAGEYRLFTEIQQDSRAQIYAFSKGSIAKEFLLTR